MKKSPVELARGVRDVYLQLNRNYSHLLSAEVVASDIIDVLQLRPWEDVVDFLDDLDVLSRAPPPLTGSDGLQFSSAFDYETTNQDTAQKLYGQGLLVSGVIERTRAHHAKSASVRIVSAGVGCGKVASNYAACLGQGDSLTGVDVHESFLRQAQETYPRMQLHPPFDLDTLTETNTLLIAPASVDVIDCSLVAHHLVHLDQLVSEFARILSPHGACYFLDLVDKTEIDQTMVFAEDHEYPPFHGIEFFRSHRAIRKSFEKFFVLVEYERIGPGLAFFVFEKPQLAGSSKR